MQSYFPLILRGDFVMRKKVLYIQPLHPSGMEWLGAMEDKYEVIVANTEDKATLLQMLPDVHAIISRLTVIDAEMIAAGTQLEAIAKHGVGVDNIDVEAATKRGIPVLTTGTANSISVAEHAFFALGALAKRMCYLDNSMRRGHWKSRDEAGSVDLFGKTVGVVGIGRIGTCFANMAKHGFGMNVIVYDPYSTKEHIEGLGFEYTDDLDDMCAKVDAITLHVPLSESTRNLIDARRLALMKPTAFVINFARGGVVNENDLYEALVNKTIKGAAIDAWAVEPPDFDAPIMKLENVILSPHCGTFSEDSRIRMSMAVAEGIDDALSGRVPKNVFNGKDLYK